MVIYLDIETVGSKADEGEVVAIGLLKGEEAKVKFVGSPEEERELLEWLKAELEDRETIVTWYGSGFDVPYLLARAALLGVDIRPLTKSPKLDLCEWCRHNLRLSSYALESVARFFGFERKVKFTGRDVPPLYRLAREGDENARSLIVQHCEDDLWLLKRVYEKVRLYAEHL
jgi:uncharacterized protein YprB with RNaseH-like and TPR domain